MGREKREREVVCLTRLSWWGVSVWRAGPGGAGGYVGDIIGTRAFPHCHVGPTRKAGDRVTATEDSSEPRH